MDTTKLQYYVTAVRLGSYEAAGKALYVSAPAIARAVHELERIYNIKLMQKSGTKATPTPIGESFCDKAEEVLQSMGDLKSIAQTASHYGQQICAIKLAAVEFPLRGLVLPPAAFEQFESRHPDISLSIIRRPSGICLAALEDGMVDAAIILGRAARPNMISNELFTTNLVAAISKTSPLSSRETVSIKDLAKKDIGRPHDLRYVLPLVSEAFRKHNTAPRYSEVPPSEESHSEFLASGGVLFVLPEPEVVAHYPDAVFLPIHDADLSIPVHLAFISEHNCHNLDILKQALMSNDRHATLYAKV